MKLKIKKFKSKKEKPKLKVRSVKPKKTKRLEVRKAAIAIPPKLIVQSELPFIPRYKVDQLVEVFFPRRGQESNSNRMQIVSVNVPKRKGEETIYTGVMVMHHNRWVEAKQRGDEALQEALEKDFLESWIGNNKSRA